MKCKLGDYISLVEERNLDDLYSDNSVVGISTKKEIISTKANLEGVKLTNYKLFPPNCFAYVSDTSRRGEKISLAYNNTDEVYILSSISIVFEVSKNTKLDSEYLYMYFNRPEFDRYARFNSWGSAREAFSWDDMCDIEIDLPPVDVQEKYVEVYKAMVSNQQAYEQGLEDLKLVCDATIEKLRRELEVKPIGHYLTQVDIKNLDRSVKLALGVNVDKEFIPAKRVADNIEGTRIVKEG